MNRIWKSTWPHLVAIAVFLLITVAYFSPIFFEGKTLPQGDIVNSNAWGADARAYHAETGEYVYWSNSMFGGMPHNYTFSPKSNNIFRYVANVVTLGLPINTAGLMFVYLLGFYVFMLAIGCSPWLSIVGAIAYALGSYNLIIIDAGHVAKGLVMATMAPLLGGIMMCYKKKYITGALIALIAAGLNIFWNHQQISYYLLIMIAVMVIVYFIYAIKEKEILNFVKASAILLVVAMLAVAPAADKLIPTMDYTKDTMRGGAVLKTDNGAKESDGLNKDYAFQWSYGKAETMTLLVPNFYGGSSHYPLGEDSETYKALRPTGQAKQVCEAAPMYWGTQPFTSGPVYAGAIVCFLFILGLLIVKGPERWWLTIAAIIGLLMSWGSNFDAFNTFLFEHLPLYNKFRTPSMSLVVTTLAMVILGFIALRDILQGKVEKDKVKTSLFISLGITVGLCILAQIIGSMSFCEAATDEQLPDWLVTALILDRRNLLKVDVIRSIIFAVLGFVVLFMMLKNEKFKPTYAMIALTVLMIADMWPVDKRFLNNEHFVSKRQENFVATAADKFILDDTDPDYRVLNLTGSTFQESRTSHFHKSVGGYSPAKFRRYQDIIDMYFNGNINMNVINMLNTRYVITNTNQGPVPQRNYDAMGNAWFVNNVQWVKTPNEEIEALEKLNIHETALVDEIWKEKLGNANLQMADSTATINLVKYVNPGNLIYESNSAEDGLAVFSEVYYKTWKAFIDGQEVTPVRANYILRALPVPAGKHTIEFKCVDELFIKTHQWSMIASIAVGCVMLLLLVLSIMKCYKETIAEA